MLFLSIMYLSCGLTVYWTIISLMNLFHPFYISTFSLAILSFNMSFCRAILNYRFEFYIKCFAEQHDYLMKWHPITSLTKLWTDAPQFPMFQKEFHIPNVYNVTIILGAVEYVIYLRNQIYTDLRSLYSI